MNYPVILTRQTWPWMAAAAGQGTGKEGVRSGAETCGSVSTHSQAAPIHPTAKEALETVFLNHVQLATAHLHLNLSFPKV